MQHIFNNNKALSKKFMAAMNKIDDKLFLGNIKSASDLKLIK